MFVMKARRHSKRGDTDGSLGICAILTSHIPAGGFRASCCLRAQQLLLGKQSRTRRPLRHEVQIEQLSNEPHLLEFAAVPH